MKNSRILLVEDDPAHRSMLKTMLKSWGFLVDEAKDGNEAVSLAEQKYYALVLTDVQMARMNGIEALKALRAFSPALPVIIMTAYSSVETAVEALRQGAYDYLIKPLDFDLLKETILKALLESPDSIARRGSRRQQSYQAEEPPVIIGNSPALNSLRDFIATVAPTEARVLITGESGTGKELVARLLHSRSPRADKPLVRVNCAALADTLLESELFGHERGSFTGADKRREGRFVQANGGTLFLDEIGEMPLSVQAKLLRALQDGEIQRVGSDRPIHVDVRVFAATNKDLGQESREKRFRQDLFFRLNVISIDVPPLRYRADDIPLLANTFLERFAKRNHKAVKGFTPRSLEYLLRYSWPGNVRELENTIERAVILCKGELITEGDLPDNIANKSIVPGKDFMSSGMSLDMMEKKAIMATLEQTGYNKSETARRLGITRATLHNKLRKYGIEQI